MGMLVKSRGIPHSLASGSEVHATATTSYHECSLAVEHQMHTTAIVAW